MSILGENQQLVIVRHSSYLPWLTDGAEWVTALFHLFSCYTCQTNDRE